MTRSNLELPAWPNYEEAKVIGIFAPRRLPEGENPDDVHPDGLLGGLVQQVKDRLAAAPAAIPVSAPAGRDVIVDITKYPQRPENAVQGNAGMDKWVKSRFSHTYMSRMGSADEKAFGQGPQGDFLRGTSVDDSEASCPAGGILCAHSHPLQSDPGFDRRSKIDQPWRLGFGRKDYLSLMHGMPNYMLNYERRLQVLEFTPSGGYTVRDLGIIPYTGPD